MKKVRSFLLAIMVVFASVFMVSCGEDKNIPVDAVELNYLSYTMVVGSSFTLEASVVPAEATDKELRFRSNDTSIAVVSSTGLVRAVGVGVTQIFVASNDGKLEENCLVQVVAEGQKLDTPFGLTYDKNTNELVWQAVSGSINNYTASYELEIVCDGSTKTYTCLTTSFGNEDLNNDGVISDNEKVIPTAKECRVRVKAKGDNTYYTDSDYSSVYSFTIQPSPSENPIISNNKIIVPSVEGVLLSQYNLVVENNNDGLISQITQEEKNKFTLPYELIIGNKNYIAWDIPENLSVGTYSYKVNVKGDESRDIYNSVYVQSISTITKLAAPKNLTINSNVISWRAVRDASGYVISVVLDDSEVYEINVGADKTEYTFTANEIVEFNKYANYLVYLTTKGNGFTTLTSVRSEDCATQKLDTPVIKSFTNYSDSYYKLQWDIVPNAAGYSVYLNNVCIGNDISSNSLEFQKSAFNVGTNMLQVMATTTRKNFTNSEKSSVFTVTKLVTPSLYTSNGVPTWSAVNGVDTYTLKLRSTVTGDKQLDFTSSDLTYELGSDYPAGEYVLSIVAKGDNSSIIESESSAEIVFTKMATPTNFRIGDDMLKWDSVDVASRYQIEITQINNNQKTYIVAEGTSYDITQYLSSNAYGNYAFKIRSYGLASTQINNTNSEFTSSINAFKLGTPENLRIENGKVAWNALDYAALGISSDLFKYRIKIGSSENTTQETTFDAANLMAKTYSVQIKTIISTDGKVSDDLYLLSSDYSVAMSMTKLETPRNVGLLNGALSWDIVKINGATGSEEIPNYTVTVKQANKTIETLVNSNSCARDVISNVSPGKATASVYAMGGSKYLNSSVAQGVEYYKLQQPTLSVQSGELYWQYVQSVLNGTTSTITQYTVNVQEANTDTKRGYNINGKNSWDMAKIDGGKLYFVSIIAKGNGTTILDSEESDQAQYYRLNAPLASSFAVNEAGDGITWSADNSGSVNFAYTYEVQITKKEINGETIAYAPINTGEANSVSFPDECTGGEYYVQVRTIAPVGQPVVSSQYSESEIVTRLASPTGLTIADCVASWNNVNNAAGYNALVTLGTETLSFAQDGYDTTNFNLDGAGTVEYEQLNNYVGSIGVKVVALSSKQEGSLIINSAPCSTINIQRYTIPDILITDDFKLTWSSTDQTDDGKILIFEPLDGASAIRIRLSDDEDTFDMSNEVIAEDGVSQLEPYKPYYLRIQALGDGSITLNSPISERYYVPVVKLVSPDYKVENGVPSSGNWRIVNGMLAWDAIPGASKYEVSATDVWGNSTTILKEVSKSESLISWLPTKLSDKVTFSIKSYGGNATAKIGDNAVQEYVFITSSGSANATVNKLPTPTNLSVRNGEIVWDALSTQNLTEYKILYGGESETLTKDTTTFILSERLYKETSLNISIYAVGTADSTGAAYENCYLNSDTTQAMKVTIKNQPTNLTVDNGVITWTDYGSHLDFEVLITMEDGEEISFVTSEKSTNLPLESVGEIAGKRITSLTVRHKGSASSSDNGNVNSACAVEINNIIKLPEINDSVAINAEGAFTWDYTNQYTDDMKNGLVLSVDNLVVNNNYAITSNTYTFTSEELAAVGDAGYRTYNISGYIAGSDTLNETGDSYIRNDGFVMQAYKFAPISNVELVNGLELVWECADNGIGIGEDAIYNNKFLIEYYYKSYDDIANNNGYSTMQTKEVVGLKSIPMWDLGDYRMDIYVLSDSDSPVLKSEPVSINNIKFNRFEAGNGSPENPFIISDTTQATSDVEKTSAYQKLSYIYAIPSCYFKLASDIDLSTEESDGFVNVYNNMPLLEQTHINNFFTGGLDGAGYTLQNFKVKGAGGKTAIFTGIKGDYREGFDSVTYLTDASRFMGRSGIICDLNITVSEMTLMTTQSTGSVTYDYGIAFVAHQSVGGWIMDVNVTQVTADPFVQTGWTIGGTVITYGGIVAYMSSFGDDDTYLDARVINCSTDIDLTLVRSSRQEKVYMGGIVGTNTAGSILGCVNKGSLSATQVGGIVRSNENKTITSTTGDVTGNKTYWGTVSGCVNEGTITGLPLLSDFGYAGGISASNDGYIVLSLNKGAVTVVNGTSYLTSPGNYDDVSAYMGGITGRCSASGAIFNTISYGMVTMPASDSQVTPACVGGMVGDSESGTTENIKNSLYANDQTNVALLYTLGNGSTYGEPSKTSIYLKNVANPIVSTLNTELTSSDIDVSAVYTMGANKPMFTQISNAYPELSWSFTNPVSA